jgi:hypothetical protein
MDSPGGSGLDDISNPQNEKIDDLWAEIAGDAGIDESSDEEVFGREDENEFEDLEDHVLAEWDAAEEQEPTDPYRVLHVKQSDSLEHVDACMASKMKACGPSESGVGRSLKLRLQRAHDLLHDSRRLKQYRHICMREILELKGEWASLKYKNGYYEGTVVKKLEPETHLERNGKGITVIAGAEKYEGEYKDDKRNGMGIQFWKNGDVYVGHWLEDKLHGNGIYYYKSGAVYIGPFVNNIRHGRGRLSWSNGGFYIGDFSQDRRTGHGYFKRPGRPKVAQVRYLGYWMNNKKHGSGRYDCDGQGAYKGQFEADEFHGDGRLKLENGNTYEGQFVQGRPQGQGSYHCAESGNKYKGGFWRGRRDGDGEFIYNKTSHIYTGQWKLNEATGRGMLQFQNGDEYDGDVMNGKVQGIGRYQWADSAVYMGAFENGLRHGEGRIDFPDSESYSGQFREDIRHGKAKVSCALAGQGSKYFVSLEETWHCGSLIERGPEHITATHPKVDDIQAWEDFMTALGCEALEALPPEPEQEQERHAQSRSPPLSTAQKRISGSSAGNSPRRSSLG